MHLDEEGWSESVKLGRLLSQADPSLLFFHGNVLIDRITGLLVALLGNSGSGKTTLSLKLLKSGRFTLLAEDVILIRPDEKIPRVFPYPKASSIRIDPKSPEKTPSSTPSILWERGKTLRRLEDGEYSLDPQELDQARVFFLSSPSTKTSSGSSSSPQREYTWVTPINEDAVSLLRDKNLPLESVEPEDGGSIRLTYQRPLTRREREEETHLVEAQGGYILRVSHDRQEGSEPVSFPASPQSARLTASDGLERLLANRVRYGFDTASSTQGPLVMRVARSFHASHFYDFTPGGTPDQSIAALMKLL